MLSRQNQREGVQPEREVLPAVGRVQFVRARARLPLVSLLPLSFLNSRQVKFAMTSGVSIQSLDASESVVTIKVRAGPNRAYCYLKVVIYVFALDKVINLGQFPRFSFPGVRRSSAVGRVRLLL